MMGPVGWLARVLCNLLDLTWLRDFWLVMGPVRWLARGLCSLLGPDLAGGFLVGDGACEVAGQGAVQPPGT